MREYLNRAFTEVTKGQKIETIIECGSRDCLDTLSLLEYYNPSLIFAFECNPESIVTCKENIQGIKNIYLIEKAVYNKDQVITFYATDMERSIDKNIGASSLLKHRDNEREFFQKEIQVEAIRLDTFMSTYNVKKVDLLCMDLQGTELLALQGLGKRLKDIHFIISEVLFQSYYHNDYLYKEVKNKLSKNRFILRAFSNHRSEKHRGFTNAIFQNLNWQ
jgi:FkbM family methyltransferase